MGSPRPAAQQILVRATVTCLFIHSLLFRFSSSLTGSSLCSTQSRRLHSSCPPLPVSSPSTAPLPLSLLPSPLSGCLLPLYTLPPALSCSVPPLPACLPLRLIRLYAARHKFIGGKRDSEGELEIERKREGGGLKRRDGSD